MRDQNELTQTKHHIQRRQQVDMIELSRIHVLNPRARNQKIFAQLVENIATLGLKRPITVVACGEDEKGKLYELICGQGRFEAFQALGENEIPCVVVEASQAERYLISLVENLARRKHSNQDLLGAVRVLEERGYSVLQISNKIGFDAGYIGCILHLLREGEERLIAAVEKGWLSVDMAAKIAKASDADVQIAMMEAYEQGLLRGEQLMKVRRLIDKRRVMGKRYAGQNGKPVKTSPQKLVQAYQAEVRRQRLIIKKADINDQRLLYVTSALRRLLTDEHFRTLLRAEGIQDMPKPLAEHLREATL
ncbi:plasmid partitioning protein RepB C-terminal domain-containing protein [Andreprevotia chitinilytica]|uniref:plasmid partitioning protein RepB C-terminal domain-containing protein n=1 Tax=Andreprevotia chitinilytica TaxID=396808 RepID=UPI000552D456|nr:plasmid partitioning protein RepB C-terminal domain-containing protein [Andreprevotia chitinilytica]